MRTPMLEAKKGNHKVKDENGKIELGLKGTADNLAALTLLFYVC